MQAGGIVSTARVDVRQDFAVSYQAFLGDQDGADGIAFLLHNDPAGIGALGGFGVAIGVGSVQNGLAFELDTYVNGISQIVSGGPDIESDHADFLDSDGAFSTTPVDLGEIEDGQWHDVVITWSAEAQTLVASFDGNTVATLTDDIANVFFGGSNYAFFAFTAGTGGLLNDHLVRNISVDATFEAAFESPSAAPTPVADSFDTTGVGASVLEVLANDTDPDGDALTISVVRSTSGTANRSDIGAAISIEGAGTSQRVRYDTTGVSQVIALAAGGTLVDHFTYQVTDTTGATATAAVTITVTGTNDAPSITSNGGGSSASISIAENSILVSDIDAVDPDAGAVVAYSISGGADAARFSINSITGVLTFVAAPDHENPGDVGGDNVYNVEVEAADGLGGIDTQSITVTVTDVGGISPPPSNASLIAGTSENDVLIGQGGLNAIYGFDGNDSLSGAGGADTLDGGNGNDTLVGGTGNDSLLGGDGEDLLRYVIGDGIDTTDGGQGSDTLIITGTTSANALDVVFDGIALSLLEGGPLSGIESVSADLLTGTDQLSYLGSTAGVIVDLTTGAASGFTSIVGVENVTAGAGADSLIGNGSSNVLSGEGGDDTIIGGLGNDRVVGGAGNDLFRYVFGDGADTVDGGLDSDTLTITGTTAANTLDVVLDGVSLTLVEGGAVTSVESISADLLEGIDLLSYNGSLAGAVVDLATGAATGFSAIAGVDNITGGSGADSFSGNGMSTF